MSWQKCQFYLQAPLLVSWRAAPVLVFFWQGGPYSGPYGNGQYYQQQYPGYQYGAPPQPSSGGVPWGWVIFGGIAAILVSKACFLSLTLQLLPAFWLLWEPSDKVLQLQVVDFFSPSGGGPQAKMMNFVSTCICSTWLRAPHCVVSLSPLRGGPVHADDEAGNEGSWRRRRQHAVSLSKQLPIPHQCLLISHCWPLHCDWVSMGGRLPGNEACFAQLCRSGFPDFSQLGGAGMPGSFPGSGFPTAPSTSSSQQAASSPVVDTQARSVNQTAGDPGSVATRLLRWCLVLVPLVEAGTVRGRQQHSFVTIRGGV